MLRIRSKKVYIDEKFVPAVIEIDNGKIRGIMDYDDEYDKEVGGKEAGKDERGYSYAGNFSG